MKNINISVEGISPLLMHRFPMAEVDAKSKAKNQKQTQDDVESYLYKDTDGTIAQPAIHFISSMKKAGARYQIPGQGKLTYKNLIGSGAVVITPEMIPHQQPEWVVDRRPVVIQRGRIVRSRPRFEKWSLQFVMEFEEDDIPKSVLKEVLEYAGRRVGIGDFRPECGGPFGRFMIVKFK